jgi:serine protease Do
MDTPQREPCSTCGEPVALEARLCAHCGYSALVELRLDAPVADARLRYQAARALSALGGPYAAVGPLQQAMAQARPRVAGGLTRGQAYAGRDVLAANGLRPSIAAASPPAGGGMKVVGGMALGAVALTLGAFFAVKVSRPAAPAPGPVPGGAAAGGPAAAAAQAQPAAAGGDLPRNELARRALRSTASLRCADSVGAGFFVAERTILTNAHVLCRGGGPLKVVLADGQEAVGTPVRHDEDLDIALVTVTGGDAPPLPLGDAAALAVGDRVLMVGSPVGMDFTVHEGMVSAMGRVILGVAYIQLDAKVNPGNSGGPLLDTQGRAVGIVSMKRSDAEGIALALPINYAWSGPAAMLDAPPGASEGFEALLARARQEDDALAGNVAKTELRPLLGGVSMNPQRQVVAQILRPARNTPYSEDFAFKVWNGTTEVCSMTASVGEWKPVDSPAALTRNNARLQAWLQKHGLAAQLYAGEAWLRLDLCARDQLQPGVQLELQGAEPSASRVVLY